MIVRNAHLTDLQATLCDRKEMVIYRKLEPLQYS